MTNQESGQPTRFSIITPVYNREDCIEKCILSVTSQDYDHLEFWIVDDGSSDHTSDIVNRYAETCPFIRFHRFEINRGVNAARNYGIQHSKHEFILFLDSDDILTPGCLKEMDKIIREYPQYNHFLFLVNDYIGLRPESPTEYTYKEWLNEEVSGDFAHVLNRKSLIDNPFDENFRLYESLNWLRIFKANRCTFYYPLLVMERDRNRSDSLSKEYLLQNKKQLEQTYLFISKYLEYYEQDLKDFGLTHWIEKLAPKAALLGIALKEPDTKNMIKRLDKINPLKSRILRLLNCRIFSPVIYFAITSRSKWKHRK